MINPALLELGFVKVRRYGTSVKFYRAALGKFVSKRNHKTAGHAYAHAMRLQARWIRLYRAAVNSAVEVAG